MTKGVYQLTFPNDTHLRVYTGRTLDLESRYQEHCSALIVGNHHNYKMQEYFDLYHEFPVQIFIKGSYNTARHEQKTQNSIPREKQWNVCPLVDNPKYKKKKKVRKKYAQNK